MLDVWVTKCFNGQGEGISNEIALTLGRKMSIVKQKQLLKLNVYLEVQHCVRRSTSTP